MEHLINQIMTIDQLNKILKNRGFKDLYKNENLSSDILKEKIKLQGIKNYTLKIKVIELLEDLRLAKIKIIGVTNYENQRIHHKS
ncbi:MAG: hypothetical protein Q4B52_03725 [Tissierellia bacterium]|nr:hypothetical protein [Tissierellia bacterium]